MAPNCFTSNTPDCVNAPSSTISCGQTVNESTFSGVNNNQGGAYDCFGLNNGKTYSGREFIYEFEHFGGPASITLFNNNTEDLDIFLTTGCEGFVPLPPSTHFVTCINSSTGDPIISAGLNYENIYEPFLAAGFYQIIVEGASNADASSFTLTYNCEDQICGYDDVLNCNQTVNHSTSSGSYTNDVANYCGIGGREAGSACDGPERVYQFEVPFGEEGVYTFTLDPTSSNDDFELFLIGNAVSVGPTVIGGGGGSCAGGCVESPPVLTGTGENEVISEFLSAGTYLVVVDGWNGSEGSYSLSVNCPAIATCEDPPNALDLQSVGLSHIRIGWPEIPGAQVSVQTKLTTSSTWSNPEVYSNWVVYSNRLPCTLYDFRVRYECGSIIGDWSNTFTYSTECETEDYCPAYGRSFDEWIDLVRVAGIDNATGNGYGHEWYLDEVGQVTRGDNYPITLSANKLSSVTTVSGFWRVYIDFNGDDDFTDTGERVLSLTGNSNATVNGTITIPSGSFSGNTRMRVIFSIEGFRTSCATDGDADVEDYTINVIDEPCPGPQLVSDCPGQSYFQNSNGSYTFTASGSVAANEPWLVDGDTQSVSGATLVITPPGDGGAEICYPFTNNEGCVDYCCEDYCFSNNFDPAIDYEYVNDGNTLSLRLEETSTDQRTWYYYSGSNRVTIGTGTTVAIPITGSCFTRTYYVRYFRNGCWRIISRTIFVCNPYDCNSIDVDYSPSSGNFTLTLNGNAVENTITWIDDDDDGEIIGDDDREIDIPDGGNNCGIRNISVRYWNGNAWRICCISYWDCDPFDCNLLVFDPTPVGNSYTINFTGPSNATDILWIDDDTGEILPPGDDDDFLPLPIPDECEDRNISIRYYDPNSGTFRICCISRQICPPVTCNDPLFLDNCPGQTYRPLFNGYIFETASGTAVAGQWLVDGQPSSAGQTLFLNPNPGDNVEICYPYLNNEDCIDYCCRDYCFTGDENPPIDYDFIADGNQLQLSVGISGTSQRTWYYFNGNSRVTLGAGTSVIDSVPGPGEDCSYRTYYLTYYDGNCWRTTNRRIYRCNPFECANIGIRYNSPNESFILSLQSSGASQIQWIDDDEDEDIPGGGGDQVILPIDPDCRERNISVRYFDGTGWRVCCISYWECDPFDCDLLVFDPTPVDGNYFINFTGPDNATEIQWIDDDTDVILPPGDDDDLLPLPIPDECEDRNISIRYFDPSSGTFRICCISRRICPPVTCNDPSFVSNCNDQSLVKRPDGSYRLNAHEPLATGESWLIDGQPVGVFGQQLNFIRNEGENNTICYPYLDEEDCIQYCCRDYCFTNGENTAINYNYSNDGTSLLLTVNPASIIQPSWYYYNDNQVVALGNSTNVIDDDPLPGGEACGYRTYYLHYFDGSCWRTVERTIYRCSPYDCGLITYRFDNATNEYILELEASQASQIQWIDDDEEEDLPGEGIILPLPIEAECRTRNISVRYFDGTGWRTCCIRLEICDPFDCQQIIPLYDDTQNSYVLSLSGANDLIEISWIDDDTGDGLPGDDGDISIPVPITGPCRTRNVSVRYYDPVGGRWRLCCVSYEQCPPANCADNVSFLQQPNGVLVFSTVATASQVNWWVDGQFRADELTFPLVIPPGEEREVCVRYFDVVSNRFITCCRIVDIPDCELPFPAFTVQQFLDSVTVTNQNPNPEWDFIWEFGTLGNSTAVSPPGRILPPGTQQICLTVIDDCGSQRRCEEVAIPDLSDNFILQPTPGVCGTTGQIVDVPVTAANYEDLLNFQFTLGMQDPLTARIVGFEAGNIPGTWDHNIFGSGAAIGILYFNDLSLTYPDGTVLFTLKIEILSPNSAATEIILLPEPVEPFVENGTSGQPNLFVVPTEVGTCNDIVLSGVISTEAGEGIAEATVFLIRNGTISQSVITDGSGAYTFTVVPDGGSYSIQPVKDINYRNHVNSGDLSAIRKHIFGTEPLVGPYRRIAADVNQPGSVNSGDLSSIRRLIFGQTPAFPDVSSWSFIPLDHQFANPNQPTESPYPQEIVVDTGSANLSNLDFIGVKMGDPSAGADPLNITATPSAINRTLSQLRFSVGQEPPVRGTTWEVEINAFQFREMVAAQFSMSWDPAIVSFLELTNLNQELELTLADNFSTGSTANGELPWLWFTEGGPLTIADSAVLFTLHFDVVGPIGDSVEIAFTEMPTNFYFENADGEVSATTQSRGFVVQQSTVVNTPGLFDEINIYPNPTTGEIILEHNLLAQLNLSLFDARGKLIRTWPTYRTGTTLNIQDVPGGVYLLRLRNEKGIGVRRLIVKD